MSTALSALLVPIDHDHKAAPYATVLPPGGYIWVAYQKEPPHLPVAVADSAEALARMVGVSRNCVVGMWSRYQSGKLHTSRYHRVPVDGSDNLKEAAK